MSFLETSKNKKILIAVIAVLIVGGGTTVGILVHNNSDKPGKAEVSSVDDTHTTEADNITENDTTDQVHSSSDDAAETTEALHTTTTTSGNTLVTTTATTTEENTATTTDQQSQTQSLTQSVEQTQRTTTTTAKTSTTTTTAATQPAVDESNSITRNGYYGKAWDFYSTGNFDLFGGDAYCWVTSTRIVKCYFQYGSNTGELVYDYELVGQEYTDFMYVYNNEIACGSYPAGAVSKAFMYINGIKCLGRDRVLYTNDIEDDGILSSSWAVWATSDPNYEYWVIPRGFTAEGGIVTFG